MLDLGCGVGHSYQELAPRVSVGVDLEPSALSGQDRETHVADMRRLPFADGSFASVVAVHSIEHVPDPERVLAQVVRVLGPRGRAVFITPNRLTFGRPDEIIDPYHYLEYDPSELRALCVRFFAGVNLLGLHGSVRYAALIDAERAELDRVLGRDPLRLRRFVPRRVRQRLYDRLLSSDRARPRPGALEIGPEDFRLEPEGLGESLDLIAVCDRA